MINSHYPNTYHQVIRDIKPPYYGLMIKALTGKDPYRCILCNSQMVLTGQSFGKPLKELTYRLKELALQKAI